MRCSLIWRGFRSPSSAMLKRSRGPLRVSINSKLTEVKSPSAVIPRSPAEAGRRGISFGCFFDEYLAEKGRCFVVPLNCSRTPQDDEHRQETAPEWRLAADFSNSTAVAGATALQGGSKLPPSRPRTPAGLLQPGTRFPGAMSTADGKTNPKQTGALREARTFAKIAVAFKSDILIAGSNSPFATF